MSAVGKDFEIWKRGDTVFHAEQKGINDLGAQKIGERLATDTFLEVLDLSGNSITSEGARHLQEALKINHTLLSLNLSGNELDSQTENSISLALIRNRRLKERILTLKACDQNGETEKVIRYLQQLSERNEVLPDPCALAEQFGCNNAYEVLSGKVPEDSQMETIRDVARYIENNRATGEQEKAGQDTIIAFSNDYDPIMKDVHNELKKLSEALIGKMCEEDEGIKELVQDWKEESDESFELLLNRIDSLDKSLADKLVNSAQNNSALAGMDSKELLKDYLEEYRIQNSPHLCIFYQKFVQCLNARWIGSMAVSSKVVCRKKSTAERTVAAATGGGMKAIKLDTTDIASFGTTAGAKVLIGLSGELVLHFLGQQQNKRIEEVTCLGEDPWVVCLLSREVAKLVTRIYAQQIQMLNEMEPTGEFETRIKVFDRKKRFSNDLLLENILGHRPKWGMFKESTSFKVVPNKSAIEKLAFCAVDRIIGYLMRGVFSGEISHDRLALSLVQCDPKIHWFGHTKIAKVALEIPFKKIWRIERKYKIVPWPKKITTINLLDAFIFRRTGIMIVGKESLEYAEWNELSCKPEIYGYCRLTKGELVSVEREFKKTGFERTHLKREAFYLEHQEDYHSPTQLKVSSRESRKKSSRPAAAVPEKREEAASSAARLGLSSPDLSDFGKYYSEAATAISRLEELHRNRIRRKLDKLESSKDPSIIKKKAETLNEELQMIIGLHQQFGWSVEEVGNLQERISLLLEKSESHASKSSEEGSKSSKKERGPSKSGTSRPPEASKD